MKKIAVIGSGFSSLTAAIDLAANGNEVNVYEKNSTIGGRARNFEVDGFTFDMGFIWCLMFFIFDKIRFVKNENAYEL